MFRGFKGKPKGSPPFLGWMVQKGCFLRCPVNVHGKERAAFLVGRLRGTLREEEETGHRWATGFSLCFFSSGPVGGHHLGGSPLKLTAICFLCSKGCFWWQPFGARAVAMQVARANS